MQMRTTGERDVRGSTVFKFPNARLFVHELLSAERLSGAEAIAHGASQLGLIPPNAIKDVLGENDTQLCNCMATAKKIVRRHFEERPAGGASKVDTEEVWSDIEKQFNQSPQTKICHYQGNCKHLESEKHNDNCKSCNLREHPACQKHAPALIDFMLQQLIRYS